MICLQKGRRALAQKYFFLHFTLGICNFLKFGMCLGGDGGGGVVGGFMITKLQFNHNSKL